MINFIKGQAYNIELKDTSIMGNNFKNVVCLGEIAGEIAGAYGDVMAGHARMASVVYLSTMTITTMCCFV